jgi:hypothetical protein
VDWLPREPPLIAVGDSFVLDRWRLTDGPVLRRLDLDPDTARFFGYSVEQATAMPDSHYDGSRRAQGNLRAWREGRELNLAIRRTTDGEAATVANRAREPDRRDRTGPWLAPRS